MKINNPIPIFPTFLLLVLSQSAFAGIAGTAIALSERHCTYETDPQIQTTVGAFEGERGAGLRRPWSDYATKRFVLYLQDRPAMQLPDQNIVERRPLLDMLLSYRHGFQAPSDSRSNMETSLLLSNCRLAASENMNVAVSAQPDRMQGNPPGNMVRYRINYDLDVDIPVASDYMRRTGVILINIFPGGIVQMTNGCTATENGQPRCVYLDTNERGIVSEIDAGLAH